MSLSLDCAAETLPTPWRSHSDLAQATYTTGSGSSWQHLSVSDCYGFTNTSLSIPGHQIQLKPSEPMNMQRLSRTHLMHVWEETGRLWAHQIPRP